MLGANIRDYTFFSYRPEEALHVSLREKQVILELLDKINEELQRCIDCYSQKIISKYIELLLDYCERFYERQFITRNEANKKIIERFDRLLDDHSILYKVSPPIFPLLRSASEYFVFLPHISMICWNMKRGNRTKNTFSPSVSRQLKSG